MIPRARGGHTPAACPIVKPIGTQPKITALEQAPSVLHRVLVELYDVRVVQVRAHQVEQRVEQHQEASTAIQPSDDEICVVGRIPHDTA